MRRCSRAAPSSPASAWSPCMAARAASSTRARPTGGRSPGSSRPCRIPVVANGDVATAADAATHPCELRRRRGDGRPRALRRAMGRRRDRARCRRPTRDRLPRVAGELADYVVAHYQDMLSLYGIESGLQAGAQASRLVSRPPCAVSRRRDAQGGSDGDRASRRHRRAARRPSPSARRASCQASRMNFERQRRQPPSAAIAAQIVLNTIRRPVIMIGAGRPHQLCQCRCRGLLPLERLDPGEEQPGALRAVRQPAADAGRPGARAAGAGQRVPRRRLLAAHRHGEDRRPLCRAGAGASRLGRA